MEFSWRENGVVEGCYLSINDDWDDILDDWEHERKAKGMATAITE